MDGVQLATFQCQFGRAVDAARGKPTVQVARVVNDRTTKPDERRTITGATFFLKRTFGPAKISGSGARTKSARGIAIRHGAAPCSYRKRDAALGYTAAIIDMT
jgi:hypothetical protein